MGCGYSRNGLSPLVPRFPRLPGTSTGSETPRAGRDYPRDLNEFLEWFSDEEACLRYLEGLRWGSGFACPHCGVVDGDYWRMRDGWRRCAACRKETSVTAGTILHRTRLPLRSWFFAIWYVVSQKNGVSALGLQRVLGFGSYETAWSWLHKLRRAMAATSGELSGVVEIDETFIGGVRLGAGGRRTSAGSNKAIVAIAVEVRGNRAGRVRMRRIPDTRKPTLTDFVLDHVERGSQVQTDAWVGYDDLGRYRFEHVVTNVSASGDPAHVVLPHVHRVASLVKRWLLGTHQGGISRDQLDFYLDEFTFRYNRRRSKSRGLLFYRLLEQAITADPTPYRSLVA